jgi:hypothetical protein
MRVEVTLEQDGKLLDRFEFEHRRGDDLISGFAAATTRFRRNHPEVSLADAGVSIRLARAGNGDQTAQATSPVSADPA